MLNNLVMLPGDHFRAHTETGNEIEIHQFGNTNFISCLLCRQLIGNNNYIAMILFASSVIYSY